MIEYKRAASVLVFNDQNELLLQLRASHDDSFPSHWDFSSSGGIDANEDQQVAAKRELEEELGIVADVKFVTRCLFKYPAWLSDVDREIDNYIYKAHHNGPFEPDLNEVEKVKFFSLEAIQAMLETDEKFHMEFLLAWEQGVISRAAA